MIKLSPMLDISDVIHKVEGLEEIHIVAVDGECKEILLLISEKGHFDGTIVCVDLGKNKVEYSFNRTKESQIQAPTGKVQKYLYLPNASVSKAGAFNSLAKEYDLIKLSSNTHLYTGASQKEDFPGKMFEVIHVLPYNKKMLKNLNAEKGFNIHLRNFPDSIQSLAKKLDIGYSGKEELFAYRNFENKPELAVCRRINADS